MVSVQLHSNWFSQQFIDITESMGYEDALITTYGGMVSMPNVRNNKRVMWQTCDEVHRELWKRIKKFISDTKMKNKNWSAYGMNERFRFYRCKQHSSS